MNSIMEGFNGYQNYAENKSTPITHDVPGYHNRNIASVHLIIVPIVFSIIVVLGVLGNILVIHVILSKKKLQTVTNLLLLNLAFSDVCFLLTCGGFSIVNYVLTEWPLGDILCRIIQYLLYVTCYVTVYTLMAVSIVRFLIVVYQQKAKIYCSKRNVLALIVLLWIIFMIAKIPILIVHGVSQNPLTERTECIIVGKVDGRRLFASFFVFAYGLPLLVICTLYLSILRYIRSSKGQVLGGVTSYTSPNPNSRKRHVTKCVIIVVLTFAVCWLPLHIHLLVTFYADVPETQTTNVLLIYWYGLSFANSMFNPFIYNYFSQEFRESFKRIVRCSDETTPTVNCSHAATETHV